MATALITGASSGLGAEFARQLGAKKYDLVLTARREAALKGVAEQARAAGAGRVRVIARDLSVRGAAAAVHAELGAGGVQVDLLINNAGFGTHGRFVKLALDREMEEIDLNIGALVAMSRLMAAEMAARRKGAIINVASTAAFQPIPFMATYGATKAFVLSFSQALAAELARSGVTVTAVCPGPTRTEFQAVAGVADARMPSFAYMSARAVVRQALDAARRGKQVRINGGLNLVMAQAVRFTPRALAARVAGAMFREAD